MFILIFLPSKLMIINVGVAAIAPWFVCAYDPTAPGSNPNHTIYAFINLYYSNHIEKITNINKKRPELAHLKKHT